AFRSSLDAGGTVAAALRAAAEAADAEAHDVPETDPAAAAHADVTHAAMASSGRRTGPVSPLDHLFDDPFDWSGA
ncbi:MAG TPA: hypothetical protein VGZ01_10740, partial [Trinickia sp.]|nr:hypothetical protein [Trinickia sp.]